MKKLLKIAIIFSTILLCCPFFFAACKIEKNPADQTKPAPSDPEYYVTELNIKTPPSKTEYYAGEAVDLSGITIEAEWNDGVVETLSTFECEVTPSGAIAPNDKQVTLKFEGKTVSYGIAVNVAVMLGISVTVPDTVITRVAAQTVCDFSGIVVAAQYTDGQSRKIAYTAMSGDREIEISEVFFHDAGKKTIDINCLGKSAAMTVDVFEGLIIEAENIVEPNAITAGSANFVERVNGNFYWVANAAEPASGGAYMGSIRKGHIMRFHISSDVERSAAMILRASSGLLLEDDGNWVPTEMGDMQVNKLFAIRYGVADEPLYDLIIPETLMLDGARSQTPNSLLWVKWRSIELGTVELKKGDNIVELTVVSEYKNKYRESCACNIDRLEVEYVDGKGVAV